MLLVSTGRLKDLQRHNQASREGIRPRDGTTLPAISKGSPTRKFRTHRRGSQTKGIDPAILDALYNNTEESEEEEPEEEKTEEPEIDEELEREVASACIPFAGEQALPDDRKATIARIRDEMRLQAPNRLQALTDFRALIDGFVKDLRAKDVEFADAQAAVKHIHDDHATETAHLQAEISRMVGNVSELERRLLTSSHECEELRQHVKELEAQLTSASAVGMTAAEASRTVAQLAKARASIETHKAQMAALQADALQAEQARREAEIDAREAKQKMQRELKETLRLYGPEKVQELSGKLEDATTELRVLKGQLKTAQVAQKQQHRLVVSWRIQVEDITKKLSEQEAEMAAQTAELNARQETIKDLKAQLSQAESDVKKTMNQLQQTNRKVNEYLDKYTRQAAYIKQQEAVWKAAEAQRMLDEMDGDESDGDGD